MLEQIHFLNRNTIQLSITPTNNHNGTVNYAMLKAVSKPLSEAYHEVAVRTFSEALRARSEPLIISAQPKKKSRITPVARPYFRSNVVQERIPSVEDLLNKEIIHLVFYSE